MSDSSALLRAIRDHLIEARETMKRQSRPVRVDGDEPVNAVLSQFHQVYEPPTMDFRRQQPTEIRWWPKLTPIKLKPVLAGDNPRLVVLDEVGTISKRVWDGIGKAKKPKAKKRPPPAGEEILAMQLHCSKLPAPKRQYKFATMINRQFLADFAWPEWNLLLEVQGGAYVNGRHTRGQGYEDDCERRSLAVTLGYSIIEATTRQVKNGNAIRWLELALRERGWTP